MRANGGVVMVNFYPGFVTEKAAQHGMGRFALACKLHSELGDDAAVDAELTRQLEEDPFPEVSVYDVVDHPDVRKVLGENALRVLAAND